METTLGVLETKGFGAALAAAEKILENKNIELIKLKRTGGGIVSLFFKGDAAELKTSFEKGIQYARVVGEIVSLHILSQVHKNLESIFFEKEQKAQGPVIPNKPQPDEIKSKAKAEEIIKKKEEKKSLKKEKTPDNRPAKIVEQKTEFVQPERIDPSKFLASSSTIQRLRKEALASESSEKAKPSKQKLSGQKSSAEINMNNLEKMNVHELRRFARSKQDFPIQGRQISRANRGELLNYFKELA